MKPCDWKSQHKLTNKAIAEKLSAAMGEPIHQETVRRVCAGDIPTKDVVAAWYEISDGAVTPNDFYDLPVPPPEPGQQPAQSGAPG